MSSGLMDTEIGGEQTQYESVKTFTEPHKKSGGQFGEPETSVDSNPEADAEANAAKGEASAEKIRYGQAISETGFGGKTTTSSGSANNDIGYGGPADAGADTEEAGKARQESGYGGKGDQDTTIGG